MSCSLSPDDGITSSWPAPIVFVYQVLVCVLCVMCIHVCGRLFGVCYPLWRLRPLCLVWMARIYQQHPYRPASTYAPSALRNDGLHLVSGMATILCRVIAMFWVGFAGGYEASLRWGTSSWRSGRRLLSRRCDTIVKKGSLCVFLMWAPAQAVWCCVPVCRALQSTPRRLASHACTIRSRNERGEGYHA